MQAQIHMECFSVILLYTHYRFPFDLTMKRTNAMHLIIIQVELETESEAEPQNEAPSRLSRKQGT